MSIATEHIAKENKLAALARDQTDASHLSRQYIGTHPKVWQVKTVNTIQRRYFQNQRDTFLYYKRGLAVFKFLRRHADNDLLGRWRRSEETSQPSGKE